MEYRFVTNWQIPAPREAVWAAIIDSLHWPKWWRGVTEVVELEPADARGIGGVRRYTFRSRLPYDLVFAMRTVRVEPLEALDGVAGGELEGAGRWQFADDATGGTLVRYEWDVRTTKRWMNLLAPIARPFFAWNHDAIMRWGEEGLRSYLAAEARPRSEV